jgi:cytochrome c oxidase subunit 1
MNDTLGQIHFWGTVVCMCGVFIPMFPIGMAGQQRRLYDPMAQFHNVGVQSLHIVSTLSAYGLAIFQLPFIYNFFHSMWFGEKTPENPWQATTLEWACPSPPPHGNFEKTPKVHRGPYEYSVPGRKSDYWMQTEAV